MYIILKNLKRNLTSKLKNGILLELNFFTVLILCFALFSGLDAITTYLVLSNGGFEENPLMNNLYNSGLPFFFLFKIGIVPIMFTGLLYLVSDVLDLLYKDIKRTDLVLIGFASIFCLIWFIASMVNLGNYFSLT